MSKPPLTARISILLFTALLLPQYANAFILPRTGLFAFAATADDCKPTHEATKHDVTFIVEACLIPVLVILSGILAGLTLGYMSLDETQLRVLSVSGTDKQREYARKIEPIRKNGHLLLTTLLLGNMIVNETLPVISEKVLGGGIQAVVVSTVLVVVFSEIIPQSLCSRFGLQIGAYMAVPTTCLVYGLYFVSWPIAKVLEWALGPHHGIVYRRNELKELINMHSALNPHGGDLQSDTVTMVGGALDFQEKVVKDAMTPIEQVFMLSIEAKMDYPTLVSIVRSGHSRVPVYEEVKEESGQVSKRILGVLLVKQCILLDPEDATPLRDVPLNTLPTVPFDEPLLHTLDRFQQGNSHMAVVSRVPSSTESIARDGSIHDEVKLGLTRRFLNHFGLGDESSSSDSDDEGAETKSKNSEKTKRRRAREEAKEKRMEAGAMGPGSNAVANWKGWNKSVALEQTMPSDAMLTEESAAKFIASLQRSPLGIITLEDVIEELIGEEILDEFDLKGAQALAASSFVPEEAQRAFDAANEKATDNKRLNVSASVTPTASASNLRITQGLRAIRLAAGRAADNQPHPPRRSSSAPGAKRGLAMTPLGLTSGSGSGAVTPASLPPGVDGESPLEAPAPLNAPKSTGFAVSQPGLSPPPPSSVASTATDITATPTIVAPIPVPANLASAGPTVILGSRDGTPVPGTPKKRAFKSLIAGGGAVPGLDRRADPVSKASGSGAGGGEL